MESIIDKFDRLNKFVIPDLEIFNLKRCTPRILVYTDGLSFSGGDFGLTDFVDTLKKTRIYGVFPIVETAHSSLTPVADKPGFEFSSSTLSISKYDVLFLFGYASSGTLDPSELSAIETFMDAGGGVFATGDHSSIGIRLCGNIKRVKEMRRWVGPTASGTDRISTNDPGSDNTFQFEDQSDTVPQKIYPAYYGDHNSSEPHYLLQHPSKKIIEVLPDHPHESECLVPSEPSGSDWPTDSDGSVVKPELVAISVSYGGGFTAPPFNKQPISEPRSFIAIAAYDGHQAGVGRISTDATWHHFVDVNMIATGDGPGLIANVDAYDRVSTYFGNIAKWLMPKRVRWCLRWPLIIELKELFPIREFLIEIPDKPGIDFLVSLGGEMHRTMRKVFTPAQVRELTDDLIEAYNEDLLRKLVDLRKVSPSIEQMIGKQTTPIEFIDLLVLGTTAYTLEKLIPSGSDLEVMMRKLDIEDLDKALMEQMTGSFKLFIDAFNKGRSMADEIVAKC